MSLFTFNAFQNLDEHVKELEINYMRQLAFAFLKEDVCVFFLIKCFKLSKSKPMGCFATMNITDNSVEEPAADSIFSPRQFKECMSSND